MSRGRRPVDAAIVGMACRFAGAADLFAFWENILAGRSSIGEVPPGRWDADVFCDPDSSDAARVAGRRGGYLDEPIELDAAGLGVMPRTVEGGEPEQFLVLDAARAALADAGLEAGVRDGRRVDVIVGRGNYFNRGNLTRLQHGRVLEQTLAILRSLHPGWSEADVEAVRQDLRSGLPPFESATIPGQLTNATAGRTSHRLGLEGPGVVVDAASASALVALDLGARAVASGRADLAIVGGVYVEADVDFPMVFSRLGVLSKSGRPRPFAADADGMVPGEGVGVVVLKRLRDAERDGDRVYAVVKGVGLASDGRGRGLASPDPRGHLRAMRRAFRRAGVDPATVSLIEGHGLGVPAADRAELRALAAAFPATGPGGGRVLGAVSGLIGHAMPASGMAGLIKAALALHHRALPASPAADPPHPMLARAADRLATIPSSRPWIRGGGPPRRAGVNAFGFAGINAHAILEEHASSDGDVPGALLRWPDEAVLLAADDRRGLMERAGWLADRLRRRPDVALKDVAATLNREATRGDSAARLGMVAASIDDLIDRLDIVHQRLADPARSSIRDGRGAYYWDRPAGVGGGLALLFPGEGSQYPGMLADLCLHFPEVRVRFDRIERMAIDSGSMLLPGDRLFGAGAGGDPSLWEASAAVPVVLASQWALYQLITRLGIRPDAICGHSSGEVLALVAAGAIAEDGRLEHLLGELATVFTTLERSGAIPGARLLGVACDRDRVEAILGGDPAGVSVAADNCPHQVVLVGPAGGIDAVAARLSGLGIAHEGLPIARAYHAPAFAPALGPIRAFFDGLEVRRPAVPLYSCCEAGRVPDDGEAVRRLAVAQWTRPVEFRRTVEAMHADGLRVFVDVGARGNLAAFVEDTLRGRDAFAVAANLPRRPGTSQLNHLVASLFARGARLDPAVLYARRSPATINLDDEPAAPAARVAIRLGFPEMRISKALAARLGDGAPPERPCNAVDSTKIIDGPGDDLIFQGAIGFDGPRGSGRSSAVGTATMCASGGEVGFSTATLGSACTSRETEHRLRGWIESSRDSNPFPSRNETDWAVRGPWAGEVQTLVEGREVVARIRLDAAGDPVAEHHTFGGRRISEVEPTWLGLPVLPFTVMAEMLAEVAARLAPGAVLVGLREVRARRWIRYEDVPSILEVRAEVDPGRSGSFRAALFNRGPEGGPSRDDDRPDVEAVVVFADRRDDPPEPIPFDLGSEAGPSRFTAESMYGEQWLFHGPALRGVAGVGRVSDAGIEGTLRVLPRRALARAPAASPPLTDPIVLDAFTHLLGLWGMERLAEGDVIFPLELGSLAIFGDDPAEGTELACRIAVRSVDRYRVSADAEIVRPDGRVWMRLTDWEDWRFYWPSRYRDGFRQPDRALLGEPLELNGSPRGSVGVWLQPPADMGRPIWRDVLERVQLSPEERSGCLRPEGHEGRRTLRLWGRIAAKEAARRLWLAEGRPSPYPADLIIEPDPLGRPVLRGRDGAGLEECPSVSIAHTEGVAVALACRDAGAGVGIDVERVVSRSSTFEELAFTGEERQLLDRVGSSDRDAWVTRFWCAKEAAGKATGRGMVDGPSSVEVVAVDPGSGQVSARLGPGLSAARPDLANTTLEVRTSTRDGYALAWIVVGGEG